MKNQILYCLAALLLVSCNNEVVSERPKADLYNHGYSLPSLDKWNAVEKGMTTKEVIQLLGKPISKIDPDGDYEPNHIYPWHYGYIAKASQIFPQDLQLTIEIEQGKVWGKSDWFGDVPISPDGLPTMPKLIYPYDGVKLDHYPRILDFRWFASSGDYPIRYEIEVNTLYSNGKWSENQFTHKSKFPHLSYTHGGSNKGKWRVRAVNKTGTSEWTEYRHFEFLR
jgi:outer membrane protein assembly factor BamE (lipoprotein component of BamABCDE complex)